MQDRQKHTPGPWMVADSERTLHQQLAMGGIAIKAHAPKYGEGCAIFNLSTNPTFGGNDMTIANARLIAAAPDMLGDLQQAQARAQVTAATYRALAKVRDEAANLGLASEWQFFADAWAATITKATGGAA